VLAFVQEVEEVQKAFEEPLQLQLWLLMLKLQKPLLLRKKR
jgi:hypothetical protein